MIEYQLKQTISSFYHLQYRHAFKKFVKDYIMLFGQTEHLEFNPQCMRCSNQQPTIK